jgi:hypothetical protein
VQGGSCSLVLMQEAQGTASLEKCCTELQPARASRLARLSGEMSSCVPNCLSTKAPLRCKSFSRLEKEDKYPLHFSPQVRERSPDSGFASTLPQQFILEVGSCISLFFLTVT